MIKKYAFYDSNNIVCQTFIAELNQDSIQKFMLDYSSLFGSVGVEELDVDDPIEIGWSIITRGPVETIENPVEILSE